MNKEKGFKDEEQALSLEENTIQNVSQNQPVPKRKSFSTPIKIFLVILIILFLLGQVQEMESSISSYLGGIQSYENQMKQKLAEQQGFNVSAATIISDPIETQQFQSSDPIEEKGFQRNLWLYLEKTPNQYSTQNYIYQNIRYFAKQSNFTINIINPNNYQNYFSREKFLKIKHFLEEIDTRITQERQSLPFIIRSIICLHALKEHGGVYIDNNLLLTEDLLWLNKIRQIPYINRGVSSAEPQVVVFFKEEDGPKKVEIDLNLKSIYRNYVLESPSIESYFIAAKLGSQFISEWIEEYKAYLFEPSIQKFRIDYSNLQSGNFGKDLSYYGSLYRASHYVLQRRQRNLNFIASIKKTPFQLAIDYYGYYAINANYFPLKLKISEKDYIFKIYQILMKYSIIQLQEMFGSLRFCICFDPPININILNDLYQSDVSPRTNHKDSLLNKLAYRFKGSNPSNNYSISPVTPSKQWDSLPKKLWVYFSDELKDSQKFRELNLKNIEKYSSESQFQMIQLNDTNACKYLTINSCQLLNAVKKVKTVKSSKKSSEILRLLILKEQGGVWMDGSCVMVENLDWLINITSNRYVANKFGVVPQVFMFDSHNRMYQRHELFDNPNYGMTRAISSPGFDLNFIATIKDSLLINEWLKQYISFLQNSKESIKQAFQSVNLKRERKLMDVNQEQLCLQTLQYVIQKWHFQLQKALIMNQKYPESPFLYWGVNKFKVWIINSNFGPNKFTNRHLDGENIILQVRYPRSYQEEILGKFKYHVKISTNDLKQLNSLFTSRKQIIVRQVDRDSLLSQQLLAFDGVNYFD